MERKTIVQKIGVSENEAIKIAKKYYTLLSAMSSKGLSQMKIDLLSFTAVKGNISYSTNREEFCKMYSTSQASMYNTIWELKKMGLLIKDGGKTKVAPKYLLDFNNNIILQISLLHG